MPGNPHFVKNARHQSVAGWRSGCARRDRTWERDRRIFDRYRAGHVVEIVAAEHAVSRSQAYRIISRIRKAQEEKDELSEGERTHRRKARALALWTQREHRKRQWRRLQFGIPYEAPYYPSAYRRRYPARLSAKYAESRQPYRIQNSQHTGANRTARLLGKGSDNRTAKRCTTPRARETPPRGKPSAAAHGARLDWPRLCQYAETP